MSSFPLAPFPTSARIPIIRRVADLSESLQTFVAYVKTHLKTQLKGDEKGDEKGESADFLDQRLTGGLPAKIIKELFA